MRLRKIDKTSRGMQRWPVGASVGQLGQQYVSTFDVMDVKGHAGAIVNKLLCDVPWQGRHNMGDLHALKQLTRSQGDNFMEEINKRKTSSPRSIPLSPNFAA